MIDKEIRVPKQQRSIEKKNKLKKTAIMLFSEKGYHNVSTNEIAKISGVSIGTLYNYFPDKKALYEELVSDLYNDAIALINPVKISTDLSPKELIKGYVALIMDVHSYMTAFQKEITSLSQQYDEFRSMEKKYRSNATEKILSLLSIYKDMIRIDDFKAAGMILQNSIEAVVHEVQFYPNSFNKETIIDELSDMLSRYIFKEEYLN